MTEYEAVQQGALFDEFGNVVSIPTGDDSRSEEFDGADGSSSFDGQFGSTQYATGTYQNGEFFPSAGNFGNYDYSDPFAGLDWSSSDSLDLIVGSDGKIGLNSHNDDNDLKTQYTSFFHRLWNHAMDTRRADVELKPARMFAVQSGGDVTNNLVGNWQNGFKNSVNQEGLYGYNVAHYNNVPAYQQPWNALNPHLATPTTGDDSTWGYGANGWISGFGSFGVDNGLWDSSWELGTPAQGYNNDNVQASQRWFDGIANGARSGESVATDASRLRCWHCDVQYMLKWNPVDKTFHTMPKNGVEDKTVTGTGTGAWGDCDHPSHGRQEVCEYSSGVCFVEERRTFGYITLVRKGCKQAAACYNQKYQNFHVQAGRQCWPGDGSNMQHKIARRPHDVRADQWIYNLVKGGLDTDANGIENNFDFAATVGANFDAEDPMTLDANSIVDDSSSGSTHGFYLDQNDVERAGATFNTENAFVLPQLPQAYTNGMALTSKCHQCCNSGNYCNHYWRPQTEGDWGAFDTQGSVSSRAAVRPGTTLTNGEYTGTWDAGNYRR
jgi:hypothetical protein